MAGGSKLIWTPGYTEGPACELYDLAHDPDEARDLFTAEHPRVGHLRSALEQFLARDPRVESAASSRADLEALKSLGYVGD